MGLFDMFRKKTDSVEVSTEKATNIPSIERDVLQDVAMCIYSLKISSSPSLKFLNDDNGIFASVYQAHMDDPQLQAIRNAYGDNVYLNLLGCHALGAGAYVTLCQAKYKKSVDSFTSGERAEILSDFRRTDPYELALKALGFAPDGNNKKCLDHIVMVGMQSYRQAAGATVFNRDSLFVYMKVLFNAGVTIVLRG